LLGAGVGTARQITRQPPHTTHWDLTEIDGVALRAAREKAGLTQHELARVVGVVGGERVAMWERGRSRPRSPRILHALATAVGVPARSLLVPPEDGPTLRWLRFAAGLGVGSGASTPSSCMPAGRSVLR
jgi:DNA-binding transcriptional regulator YiaG